MRVILKTQRGESGSFLSAASAFPRRQGWREEGLSHALREHFWGSPAMGISSFLRTFLIHIPRRGLPDRLTKKRQDSGWWQCL